MNDTIDSLLAYVFSILIGYYTIYIILNWIAWNQFQMGNVKTAMQLCNLAVRFFFRPTRALINRSAMYLNYFSDYEGAINDSTRAIQYKQSTSAMAYNNRGYAYYCLNQIDKSLADFDKALDLQPELAMALSNRARIYYERFGDYQSAIRDYESAISIAPQFFDFYHLLITIYLDKRDFDAAVEVCKQASENSLDPAYIHTLRAYVLERQLGIEQAFEDLKAAANLKPDDLIVVTMRGDLFAHAHDYKKAIEAYDKAIQLTPQNAVLYAIRANIYSRLSEFDEAMADFERAIETNPYSGVVYNNRADLFARLGNYLESLVDANHSIRLAPFFKYGYDTRGQTHFLMENYADALADFEKSAELKNGDEYARIGQAVTHYAMNNTETAKQLWQDLIEEDSKYTDVQAFADDFAPAEPFLNALRELATLGELNQRTRE